MARGGTLLCLLASYAVCYLSHNNPFFSPYILSFCFFSTVCAFFAGGGSVTPFSYFASPTILCLWFQGHSGPFCGRNPAYSIIGDTRIPTFPVGHSSYICCRQNYLAHLVQLTSVWQTPITIPPMWWWADRKCYFPAKGSEYFFHIPFWTQLLGS